jgi:RNA polymerase sigma-70 factor (ECF subfamily)
MIKNEITDRLCALVIAAQGGDISAYESLVRMTQVMALAAAMGVLRDRALAEDAVQQAYLRAFRRLQALRDAAAFTSWLRRTVTTVALNLRRTRRATFLCLEETASAPVLDEDEEHWSESQRIRLATALLTLSSQERRICDRRYHGGWSIGRLAQDAAVDEATMRKRLQRIRHKLRQHIEAEEIEFMKERGIDPSTFTGKLPAKLVELLASPQLTDIPENPVGYMLEELRGVFPECVERELPETLNLDAAHQSVASDAMYVSPSELHRIDEHRILRYDLTLPLLLSLRYEGQPLRVRASGKVYRACQADATHLEAFHQLEAFWLDERSRLDPWGLTGRVLQSVDRTLPGRAVKIDPVQYPMCAQAWELSVDDQGQWTEVMAWGVFTDRIMSHLGGDPSRHVAMGVGYGLERFAMLRYGIDDIRRIDVARVA